MMDIKYYVSIEAAKLLKEKGYDRPTDYIYVIDGQFYSIWRNKDGNMESNYYPSPTKAEAIDWLESKGFYIDIVYINVGKWACTITIPSREIIDMELSETRLEAEEAAIIKALELL